MERDRGEPRIRRLALGVEERLRQLSESGGLRGLPGEGAPLPVDPDAAAGDEWAARHLVRTAKAVPAWIDLRREIAERAARLRRRAAAHGDWLVEREDLLRRLPADRILEARHATARRDARVREEVSTEAEEVNTLIRRHNLHVTPALQLPLLDTTALLP